MISDGMDLLVEEYITPKEELDLISLLQDRAALRNDMRMVECCYVLNAPTFLYGPPGRLCVDAYGVVAEIIPLIERVIVERKATEVKIRFEAFPPEPWIDFKEFTNTVGT